MIKNNQINILGIPIDPITYNTTLEYIEDLIKEGGCHQVATVNPEFIMHSLRDREFREALLHSSLNTADGIGILWASKFIKLRKTFGFQSSVFNFALLFISLTAMVFNKKWLASEIPERVTGIDLVWKICAKAQEKDWTIFLLGGKGEVAQITAQKLKYTYPELKIVGFSGANPGDEGVAETIAKIKPDVLFVAYGGTKQEKFIHKNLEKMRSKVVIGVGGSFDFIAGRSVRAPKVFQNLGIEWLYRLLRQPKRIGRIFNAFPRFVWKIYRKG